MSGVAQGTAEAIRQYRLNLCVDVSSADGIFPSRGADLILRPCQSSLATWSFSHENKLIYNNSGGFFSSGSILCLDIENDVLSHKTSIILWNCDDIDDIWDFIPEFGNSRYGKLRTSISRSTPYCLNAREVAASNASVGLLPCSSDDTEFWTLE